MSLLGKVEAIFTDEEWIPQHRIVYFRRKGDELGRKVWDREKRLDRLFGSGIVDQPDKHEEPQDQEDQEEQDDLNNEPRAVVSDQPDDACDSKTKANFDEGLPSS